MRILGWDQDWFLFISLRAPFGIRCAVEWPRKTPVPATRYSRHFVFVSSNPQNTPNKDLILAHTLEMSYLESRT